MLSLCYLPVVTDDDCDLGVQHAYFVIRELTGGNMAKGATLVSSLLPLEICIRGHSGLLFPAPIWCGHNTLMAVVCPSVRLSCA